jgi:hypothetical protein
VFDKVGLTADDTRHQDLFLRHFRLLPHAPLMLVTHIERRSTGPAPVTQSKPKKGDRQMPTERAQSSRRTERHDNADKVVI